MACTIHILSTESRRGRGLQRIGGKVAEKDLYSQVTEFATACGWRWWHFHDSRRQVADKRGNRYLIPDADARGYPDMFLTHPTRGTIHAELKGSETRVEKHQIEALDHIGETAMSMAVGALPTRRMRVHLWRPDDLPGIIVPVLQRGVGPICYGWANHGR